MPYNGSKPTDLSFPLTARGVEDINIMFEKLFSKLPLDTDHGGTGLGFGSVAIGDVFYGNVTSTGKRIFSPLADVTVGSYLRSGGILTAPLWSTVKIPNTALTGDLWYGSAVDTVSSLIVGTVGKVIRSSGTLPVYSTFTIPDTYAQGDVLYASGANVLAGLAKNASATRYLSNTGASNAPAWAQVALTTGVSGTLPEASGGTGQANWVTGDIVYSSSTDNLVGLAIGGSGSFLRSNSAIPFWSTLTIPNTALIGGVFVATAANVMGVVAPVAVGQLLISAGTGAAPVFSATPSATAWRINGGAGAVGSVDKIQKSVATIADATLTTILTITIPNAAHSATVLVSQVGSLGAGGAIGANEASASNSYYITVTRTAGVNAVAAISPAFGAAAVAVAGAATVTSAVTVAAVVGAVGASNSFPVQVTITKSGGASANHTCQVLAEVINANATGVTVS